MLVKSFTLSQNFSKCMVIILPEKLRKLLVTKQGMANLGIKSLLTSDLLTIATHPHNC